MASRKRFRPWISQVGANHSSKERSALPAPFVTASWRWKLHGLVLDFRFCRAEQTGSPSQAQRAINASVGYRRMTLPCKSASATDRNERSPNSRGMLAGLVRRRQSCEPRGASSIAAGCSASLPRQRKKGVLPAAWVQQICKPFLDTLSTTSCRFLRSAVSWFHECSHHVSRLRPKRRKP